jgi:hypothetical protein
MISIFAVDTGIHLELAVVQCLHHSTYMLTGQHSLAGRMLSYATDLYDIPRQPNMYEPSQLCQLIITHIHVAVSTQESPV